MILDRRIRGWRIPRLRGTLPELFSLLGGLLIWEIVGRALELPWLPSLSETVARLFELIDQGLILVSLADSLQAMMVGFGISLVISLMIAFLMVRFALVEHALAVWVYAFFVLPSIAVAPLYLALFGISNTTRVAVIVTYCTFIMILNFQTAFRLVDRSLTEMAVSYGASERQRVWLVMIPASLPLGLATVRLGVGRAIKGMINGEQFIALFGLGGLVRQFGNQFDSTSVLAIVLVIIVVALMFDWVIRVADRRLTTWAPR